MVLRPILILLCVLILPVSAAPRPAHSEVSLVEMSRIEAAEVFPRDNSLTLFNGYLALGLLPDAASHVERRLRMGTFSEATAAPLFDSLVEAQSRFDEPERLIAICETAIRNGIRTPQVLYFYATGLRRIPGRLGEASAILAEMEPGSPHYLLALYSLGQLSAARRDLAAAERYFRRVERGVGEPGGGARIAWRAARSRAEMLLSNGRGGEAATIFKDLLRRENHPLDRIGMAAAGTDPVSALEQLPAETIAALPLKERTQYHLLLGGLARESGRYSIAVDQLTRATKELEEWISSPSRPNPDSSTRTEIVESLRIQMDRLGVLRRGIPLAEPVPDNAIRRTTLEMLTGLLLADWTIHRSVGDTRLAGVQFLSPSGSQEILLRIEEVVLGTAVDDMAKRLQTTLDTHGILFRRNLPSPVGAPDISARLKGSREEIHRLRGRIRERRSKTPDVAGFIPERDASLLMRDLGFYLQELEAIRSLASQTEIVIGRYSYRSKAWASTTRGERFLQAIRESLSLADGRMKVLLSAAENLERHAQAAARERRKPQWIALRAAVKRHLADALVAEARWLRQDPGENARDKSISAIERVVSLLSGNQLLPEDASFVAVQVGSLLAEGEGRWERFPGRLAGEREKKIIARILPLLPAEAPSLARPEESLYLKAILGLAVKDPGAATAARTFLEKYPASPLSAEIGILLGHEALLSGENEVALSRYRAAAEKGRPEASAIARYMLARERFQRRDVDSAVRELSPHLSDPSFPCGDLSPFEREVIVLSVRAWGALPPETLDAYPPVNAATCGGKALLTALWEAEQRRGESGRAGIVRDIALRRFPSEEFAAVREMRAIETLLRAGRDREALGRVLKLRVNYGPGSAWARSQPALVGERAAVELTEMLKTVSAKFFDKGVASGERSAMSAAAAVIGEYFAARKGESTDEDSELLLKRAIALLGSGDRQGAGRILEELVAKRRKDSVGERAALLYAETMIAGYERNEAAAEKAEEAALHLLGEQRSAKTVSLALRASSAFVSGGEYHRAERLAEAVETSRLATPVMVAQARLIRSESALFRGELVTALGVADRVLSDPSAAGETGISDRARDLYLLSSLKEVERKASEGDRRGAADILDRLSLRFPAEPETPAYLLRAMRLYAESGNGEQAIRSGLRFLREYSRRETATEVAALVGPLLEERKDSSRAGDLYENVATSYPKSAAAPRFLFHAARLAELHGPPDVAERRFLTYRARYASPAWMWAYATLSAGLAARQRGDSNSSIRLIEEGLRKVDTGSAEERLPEALAPLTGKARIAIGENWARQFRMSPLVAPLEKSIVAKDRFFRQALGAFEKAESEAPLEISLQASRLSGDLLMDYGNAILASQRPKGLTEIDRESYEKALMDRARSFFERSVERYGGALERLEKEGGPSDLAAPIRVRMETARELLESTAAVREGGAK
jgi:tetratricopeptide (TPR) repeat protein